jgi:glycosyltransferase involved in cell wall biosynthesis
MKSFQARTKRAFLALRCAVEGRDVCLDPARRNIDLMEKYRMKKAIVIPSYRAEKTLPSVLPRIPEAFWDNGVAIVVNDKSPDKTGEVAETLKNRWPGLDVVHHTINRGYGGAQKTGLKRGLDLGAGVFAVVHSDGQYAPEVVLDLMKPILEGKAQTVQGSRMVGGGALRGGMPYARYIPNRLLTFLENIVFGTQMAEFHSGYMLYSRSLLERAPFEQLQNNYNFDAEMIVVAHLLGMECAQIAIPTRYDDEVSSLNPIPYGINVLKMMVRHLGGHYRKLVMNKGKSSS